MGLPVVGGIFYGQMAEGKKHLKLSQKVMHTRVYGQATVLGMLVSLMVFRDYMDRHGRFMEGWEAEEEDGNAAHEMKLEAEDLMRQAREHLATPGDMGVHENPARTR